MTDPLRPQGGFADLLGYGLASWREDYAEVTLAVEARHMNRSGVLHGGVVTTLIDSTAGAAVYAALPAGTPLATLDMRIDYLRPAEPDKRLYARAEVYRTTRQIVFVRATAYQAGPNDLVANAVGTFMATRRLGPRTSYEKGEPKP